MSAREDLLKYCLEADGIFEITADSYVKAREGYQSKPNLHDLTAYTILAFKPGTEYYRYFLLPNPGPVRDKALRLKREMDAEADRERGVE